MKNLTVSLFALSLSATLFAGAKKPAAVSPEERIRKAIDNICGDTWCEGDYRYVFTDVVIDKEANQFAVNFTMTPYLDEETVFEDETVKASILPGASVKCVVKGHSDADLIVSKIGQLDWTVYETLSKCVNSLETKLLK